MVKKAELEGMGPMYLQALCMGAGLDGSGSKAQLVNRLIKAGFEPGIPPEPATEPETEPTAPAEPSEPPEPSGEGTGEPGEGEGSEEP